ncbi:MAG: RNA-binding protein [Firmicutes bacterium]|nr:RNA-binding protein [Bacillota bacterium]
MSKKLYVGGLSYETGEEGLRAAFSEAGTVETVNVISDRISGRSKGFGFVEMASDEDAQKAIELLNGKEFEGRRITVNEARPMEARSNRRDNSRGGSGGGSRGFSGSRKSW